MTPKKPLTPVLYLYMIMRRRYVEETHKEPDKYEQFEMYTRAKYDYEHAPIRDKFIIERQVERLNKRHHFPQKVRVELVEEVPVEDIGDFGKSKKKKSKKWKAKK